MEGWICLHRCITDHWVFTDSYFRKWVDLVMLAGHKKSTIFIDGTRIELDRGQLAWSQLSLAKRWGCSRQNVRTLLKNLEKDFMISQKSNQHTTIITICNYSKYQEITIEPNQRLTNAQPTPNQRLTTNNNENNENNENNNTFTSVNVLGKRKKFAIPSLSDVANYCAERSNNVNPQKFIDYYSSNGWRVGKNSMKDWKAAIRTWESNSQISMPQEPTRNYKVI